MSAIHKHKRFLIFLFLVSLFNGCLYLYDRADEMPDELKQAIEQMEEVPDPDMIQLRLKQDGIIKTGRDEAFSLEPYLINKSDARLVISHSGPLFRVIVYRSGEVYYPGPPPLFTFLDLENIEDLEPGERLGVSRKITLSEPGRYFAVAVAHRFGIGKTHEEILRASPEDRSPDYWIFTEPLEIRVE
jgi:hypothetical protein